MPMSRVLKIAMAVAAVASAGVARAATLGEEIQAFLRLAAVTGREGPAAELVLDRLAGLPARRDAVGDVVVTLGSGEPRRLVACALGEPGFVVSAIREDGYLRLVPVGSPPVGALWTQSHEGQTVIIGGAQGWRSGVVALPSVHLQQEGTAPSRRTPASVEDLYVDVGAETSAEVAELGIRILDPVALSRRPQQLGGDLLAGVAAAQKGACAAAVEAARGFEAAATAGTVVFAWTVGDGFDGAGLLHVVRTSGPFTQAILLAPAFGWQTGDGDPEPRELPSPGVGAIAAGRLPDALRNLPRAPHAQLSPSLAGTVDWGAAQVGYLGLPARYPGTPVETISTRDAEALVQAILGALGKDTIGRETVRKETGARRSAKELSAPPPLVETRDEHEASAQWLGRLVASYGVSGAEAPVREEILRALPPWAKPSVDGMGNVVVTVGAGAGQMLFVAHQDEVGFGVEEVLPDGRLRLAARGGLLPSVWEAQAALVHGDRGPVPGVFEPRADWRAAKEAQPGAPLTVYLGVASAREAEAMGVHAGSTVTMPKALLRLGRHRVTGRSLDDRVGSTALLMALGQLDPARLHRRITFAWSVGEELGLKGSAALAKALPGVDEVHAIDTFVSADSPIESQRFATARLGHGAVLRGMDNGYLAARSTLDRFLALGSRLGIPLQVGFTGGGTDGLPFLANGASVLTFSWPGRYSHSPVEVADLRDVETLVRLIVATANEP